MPDKLNSDGLKAFADTTRQIITLSTGVTALTVTFLEKVIQPSAPTGVMRTVPWPIIVAWIAFGVAILGGLWALLAISGSLDALDRKQNGLPTSPAQEAAIAGLTMSSNVRTPAFLMICAFFAGMVFTIATGFALI
jgi:hypothetical protein